jgi:hypothetical protein
MAVHDPGLAHGFGWKKKMLKKTFLGQLEKKRGNDVLLCEPWVVVCPPCCCPMRGLLHKT